MAPVIAHVINNGLALAILSADGSLPRHLTSACFICHNAASVNPLGRTRLALLAAATALLVALPAGAAQAAKPDAGAAATGISVGVKGNPNRVDLLKKVTVAGQLTAPPPNDNVQLTVSASGRELFSKKISPKGDGSFEMPLEVNACCRYVIEAENAGKRATADFKVDVPKHAQQGRRRPALQPLAAGPGLPHRDQGRPRHDRHPPRDQGLPQDQRHGRAASPTGPRSSARC